MSYDKRNVIYIQEPSRHLISSCTHEQTMNSLFQFYMDKGILHSRLSFSVIYIIILYSSINSQIYLYFICIYIYVFIYMHSRHYLTITRLLITFWKQLSRQSRNWHDWTNGLKQQINRLPICKLICFVAYVEIYVILHINLSCKQLRFTW